MLCNEKWLHDDTRKYINIAEYDKVWYGDFYS